MSTTEASEGQVAHGAHGHPEHGAAGAPHGGHAAHGDHGAHGAGKAAAHAADHGQQHPLKLYLVVWALLFILSTFSYLVDYFNFQGYARWFLILVFMFLKAGAIVAIFMHMAWERLALTYAILLPPLALTVFMGMMAFEGGYTNGSREAHFDAPLPIAAPAEHETEGAAGAAVEHAHAAAPESARAPVAVAEPAKATLAPVAPAPASEIKPADAAPHAWAPEWLRSPAGADSSNASSSESSEPTDAGPHAWAPEWLR